MAFRTIARLRRTPPSVVSRKTRHVLEVRFLHNAQRQVAERVRTATMAVSARPVFEVLGRRRRFLLSRLRTVVDDDTCSCSAEAATATATAAENRRRQIAEHLSTVQERGQEILVHLVARPSGHVNRVVRLVLFRCQQWRKRARPVGIAGLPRMDG